MPEKVIEISAPNFKKEVLDSSLPVLVDFWAEWCMPCRIISPIIDELSGDYKGKVKFVKVNVDDNAELATELQILSIPLLILFKDGRELTRMVGANPKTHIQREIDGALNK